MTVCAKPRSFAGTCLSMGGTNTCSYYLCSNIYLNIYKNMYIRESKWPVAYVRFELTKDPKHLPIVLVLIVVMQVAAAVISVTYAACGINRLRK